MEITAKLKHLRISPRKVRLVVNVIRKMPVTEALDQLKFMNKRAAQHISRLVSSAIANAESTYNLDKNNLYIKEIRVDESATLKRWMPRAHGRATTIRKRGSHIFVSLHEIKDSGKKTKKVLKAEAPVKLDDLVDNKGLKTNNDKKKEDNKNPNTEQSGKGFTSKVFRRKAG